MDKLLLQPVPQRKEEFGEFAQSLTNLCRETAGHVSTLVDLTQATAENCLGAFKRRELEADADGYRTRIRSPLLDVAIAVERGGVRGLGVIYGLTAGTELAETTKTLRKQEVTARHLRVDGMLFDYNDKERPFALRMTQKSGPEGKSGYALMPMLINDTLRPWDQISSLYTYHSSWHMGRDYAGTYVPRLASAWAGYSVVEALAAGLGRKAAAPDADTIQEGRRLFTSWAEQTRRPDGDEQTYQVLGSICLGAREVGQLPYVLGPETPRNAITA